MEQRTIANILKGFLMLTAAAGLVFFLWYLPELIAKLAEGCPEGAWLRWPGTAAVWAIGVICYAALFFFWRICGRIGEGRSFCSANVKDMRRISYCAAAILILILAGEISLAVFGYLTVRWFMNLFFLAFLSFGVFVLSASLAQLIASAAAIKQENDLTV